MFGILTDIRFTSPGDHESSEPLAQVWDSPIHIDSDDDFVTLGLPGIGTWDNPYVIESYKFYSLHYAISISNTRSFCIIRNSDLGSYDGTSLWLVNVTHVSVQNCELMVGPGTVLVTNSTDITLKNCFTNSTVETKATEKGSITFSKSGSCVIEDNDLEDVSINVLFSTNVTIRENRLANGSSDPFVMLDDSQDLRVEDNIFVGPGRGLGLDGVDDILIKNNNFSQCGLFIDSPGMNYSSTIITDDNIVNGKRIGYFVDLTDSSIDVSDYGQVILLHCNNLNITGDLLSNVDIGIGVYYSEKINIFNISLSNTWIAVEVSHSNNCSIYNSRLTNSSYGISTDYSLYALISNNIFLMLRYALTSFMTNSSVISGNFFMYCYDGLFLHSSSFNIIYRNVFWKITMFDASDLGDSNQWDYNGQGNYWEDARPGEEYFVNSDGSAIDRFPIRICDVIEQNGTYVPVVCSPDILSIILAFGAAVVVIVLLAAYCRHRTYG